MDAETRTKLQEIDRMLDEVLSCLNEPAKVEEPKDEPKPAHKYKVGDWVRMTRDFCGHKNGMAYKVVEVDETCAYTHGDTMPIRATIGPGFGYWLPYDFFEPWTPRVGERVRVRPFQESWEEQPPTFPEKMRELCGQEIVVVEKSSSGWPRASGWSWRPEWLEPVTKPVAKEPDAPAFCPGYEPKAPNKPPRADRRP